MMSSTVSSLRLARFLLPAVRKANAGPAATPRPARQTRSADVSAAPPGVVLAPIANQPAGGSPWARCRHSKREPENMNRTPGVNQARAGERAGQGADAGGGPGGGPAGRGDRRAGAARTADGPALAVFHRDGRRGG